MFCYCPLQISDPFNSIKSFSLLSLLSHTVFCVTPIIICHMYLRILMYFIMYDINSAEYIMLNALANSRIRIQRGFGCFFVSFFVLFGVDMKKERQRRFVSRCRSTECGSGLENWYTPLCGCCCWLLGLAIGCERLARNEPVPRTRAIAPFHRDTHWCRFIYFICWNFFATHSIQYRFNCVCRQYNLSIVPMNNAPMVMRWAVGDAQQWMNLASWFTLQFE